MVKNGFEHQIRISELIYKKIEDMKYEYRVKSFNATFDSMLDEISHLKTEVTELRQQRTTYNDIIYKILRNQPLDKNQLEIIKVLLPNTVVGVKEIEN